MRVKFMIMPQVVILAGGLATRLHPVTKTTPKAMLVVAGEPFISHQIKLLKSKGVREVIICAGYLGKEIKEFVGDGKNLGVSVKYSFDGDKLLGTGGAVRKALPLLGDLFWVLYGDSYLDTDYSIILNNFLPSNKVGLMTVFKNEGRWGKSNVHFRDGKILKYDKKNPVPSMKYIDYGLNLLRKEAIEGVPEDEIFDLADLYAGLVDRGEMLGFEVKERFYEIGSLKGLRETREYLRRKANFKGERNDC